MSARGRAVVLLDQLADGTWSAGSDSYMFTIEAMSKAGTVFVASGCHSLVVRGMTAAEGWPAMLADLRLGVEACEDPRCEVCD